MNLEIRRNVTVAGAIAGVAGVVALAYLTRAVYDGAGRDWLLFAVMALVAAAYGQACWDARTPLWVADEQGLRVRSGRTWRGLTWDQVHAVEVLRRRRWRDGTVDVLPRGEEAGDGPISVPLSLSTRIVGAEGQTPAGDAVSSLVADLARLADGRAEVVEIDGFEYVDDAEWASAVAAEPAPALAAEPVEESIDRPVDQPADQPAEETVDEPALEPAARLASPTPSPLREPQVAVRAEVAGTVAPAPASGPAEPAEPVVASISAPRALHRPGSVDLVEDTVVWADRETPEEAPPRVPVIGPQLLTARTRLGLTVDQLADRTRIRPHVIESIEIDDFGPCGGDFYARGHLRTLARVLGLDSAPLVATYDDRYADAPIDPRRVFEAELAGAAIRGTRGGPNWSVLTAAVMVVVLAWSIARLVTDRPETEDPRGAITPAGSTVAGGSVPVALTAAGGGARVVVRDGRDRVVFQGTLVFGQTKQLRSVSQPVRVQTTDGSLEVRIGSKDRGAIGTTGRPAQATYVISGG